MLGADVVVQQPIRFFGRKLQHALGFGAERDLHRRGNLLAEDRAAFNLFSDVFEGQVRASENATREPFALANQPQQQVLGLDRYAAELARFVAGEEEHPSGAFSVTFEHPLNL